MKGTQFDPVPGYALNARGYPDVSVLGSRFYTIVNQNVYSYSGSTASVTVMAGFLSLINAQLVKQNKPLLGFVNPYLYANSASFIRDITEGCNFCNSNGVCCPQGYFAVSGWDPITGLGSPDYANLLATILESSRPPSTSPTMNPTTQPTTTKAPSTAPTLFPTKTISPTSQLPLTTAPTVTAPPTTVNKVVYKFLCPAYVISNSYSNTKNATSCEFLACAGNVLSVKYCKGNENGYHATCFGDTFIQFYDANGVLVAQNDDACGICSAFTYQIPSNLPTGGITGAACQYYSLRQGCYGAQGVCGGTAVISVSLP